jgi:hypothetical protein
VLDALHYAWARHGAQARLGEHRQRREPGRAAGVLAIALAEIAVAGWLRCPGTRTLPTTCPDENRQGRDDVYAFKFNAPGTALTVSLPNRASESAERMIHSERRY